MKKIKLAGALVPALLFGSPAIGSASRSNSRNKDVKKSYVKQQNSEKQTTITTNEKLKDPFSTFGASIPTTKKKESSDVLSFLRSEGLLTNNSEQKSITSGTLAQRKNFAHTTANNHCHLGAYTFSTHTTSYFSTVVSCQESGGEWHSVSDSTAPTNENSKPAQNSVTHEQVIIDVDINEAGKAYAVAVANGASAPSSAQVKAGQNSSGASAVSSSNVTLNSGGFSGTITLTGLSASTAYDIYVVAEDDEGTPNLQASPTKVDITTSAPPNAAPTITGAQASQAVNDTATLTPFSNITLADGEDDNISVTITLDDNNKGVLSGTGLSGTGPYTIASDSVSSVQTILRALTFNPADNKVAVGQTETTTFSIVANDGTSDSTTNSTTTVVSTSMNDAPTDISLSSSSVAQSGGTNATVGTLSATDVDPSDGTTFTLVSGTGDTNNASFNINGTTLRASDAASLSAGSYSVRVNVNDGDADFAKALSITVTDDVDPSVSTYSPSVGATDAGLSANLVLTFSENVAKGTGNIVIKAYSDDSTLQSIDVTSNAVTINNNEVAIAHSTDFALNTQYYVTVDATAFDDASGNSFAGISSKDTWKFTSANNQSPIISEGATKSISTKKDTQSTFILNASDAESETITWSISSQGSKGTATISSTATGTSQTITYTPNSGEYDMDSFVVQASDGTSSDNITINMYIKNVLQDVDTGISAPSSTDTTGSNITGGKKYTQEFTKDGETQNTEVIVPTTVTTDSVATTAESIDTLLTLSGSKAAKVQVNNNGTVENHIEVSGKKIKVQTTVVGADVNVSDEKIETIFTKDANTTMKAKADVNGTVEHFVTLDGNKTSKATSTIVGAETTINETEVETAVEKTVGSATVKAVVVTDDKGKATTKFVDVNGTTETDKYVLFKSGSSFEAGNEVTIKDSPNGGIVIETKATLTDNLTIK